MDVATFLTSLLDALAGCFFVRSVELHTEVFVVKGRVLLDKDRFLQVQVNEQTGTTAFALIEEQERLWGIDYDATRGWHMHPVDRPEHHQDIGLVTPGEVVEALEEAWEVLP